MPKTVHLVISECLVGIGVGGVGSGGTYMMHLFLSNDQVHVVFAAQSKGLPLFLHNVKSIT